MLGILGNIGLSMSGMGQKQTFSTVCVMSALPPKADVPWRS